MKNPSYFKRISLGIVLSIVGLVTQSYAQKTPGGGVGTGGGDVECEARAKFIRDDLATWIRKGGPIKSNLDLKSVNLTPEEYSLRMLPWLEDGRVKIRCVDPESLKNYPEGPELESLKLLVARLFINGTPKKCTFEDPGNGGAATIVCDSRFMRAVDIAKSSNDESLARDQYVQIHHEIAGLAGIEAPKSPDANLDDSHYSVSQQFGSFLGPQTILSLQGGLLNPPIPQILPAVIDICDRGLIGESIAIAVGAESCGSVSTAAMAQLKGLKIKTSEKCNLFEIGNCKDRVILWVGKS